MIQTWANTGTADVFNGVRSKAARAVCPTTLVAVARRKLTMVNIATRIEDLRVPPGNRLEKLDKDRKGQWTIRINEQYRVCFRWEGADAYDVEIVDYH